MEADTDGDAREHVSEHNRLCLNASYLVFVCFCF